VGLVKNGTWVFIYAVPVRLEYPVIKSKSDMDDMGWVLGV